MTQEASEKVQTILDKADLDWTVKTAPLFLKGEDGNYGQQTDYVATVREDTQDVFGVFKKYEIFQNSELAELAYRVAEKENLTIKSGGQFKGGKRVFLQLQNGDTTGIGKNKDTINNYITAINSFDGSTSLRWGYANTVVSCSNTFWGVYKALDNSLRHTSTMKQKVEYALRDIENTRRMEQKMIDTFWKLTEIATNEIAINNVIKLVFKTDVNSLMSGATRTQNQAIQLIDCINSEQDEKGETLWGLFNGVTKYTTHYAGTDGGREMSKVMGINNRIDNKVLQTLTSLI